MQETCVYCRTAIYSGKHVCSKRSNEKKEYLLPIEVGSTVLKGQAGKVVSTEPYVKLINNPTWNGRHWVCLAQVDSMLALISVRPYYPTRKEGVKDNDENERSKSDERSSSSIHVHP